MKPATSRNVDRTTRGASRARRTRGGATVMEMLIALAISITVLAAVAVAVDASFKASNVNLEQSNLNQRSRLTMNRILTDIRTTNAHQPVNTVPLADFKAGKIVSDLGLVMLNDAGQTIEYRLDPAGKKLMYKGTNGKTVVAATGVEEFSVKFEPMRSELSQQTGGVYDQLLRATVLITLRTQDLAAGGKKEIDQKVTLSSSVMPRRNTW